MEEIINFTNIYAKPIVSGLWDYIQQNPISCIIVALFVLIIFKVARSSWPSKKEFNKLREKLRDAINQLPGSNHREEFVKKYHKINKYFSSDESTFSHIWEEFAEQLVEPQEEAQSQKKAFQNSIRPQKFFTLEALLNFNKINLISIHSAPGILVGLGVLGTFVGLTMSLFTIPDLTGNPDPKESSEAVQILISGSGVAFITSIIGLSCSLLFTHYSDKILSDLQNLIDEFNANLEKSLLFITEEHLLVQHFKEFVQQSKYLENMDEKIALRIGDIIKDSNQNISKTYFT